MTSLAAVFRGVGQPLQLDQFTLPTLKPGEALVRVTCCTLCGSDLHTYRGDRSTPLPTILGHEILGTLAEIGPGGIRDQVGEPFEVGDRVLWSVAASCGRCFYCGHDLPQKCETLFKYGHEALQADHALSGGLAEFCHLAKGTTLVRVPKALSDLVACPASCATATVAAVFRITGGCEGASVLIQGAGMLGLTACAMARAQGAETVIATDLDSDRLELAQHFGATHLVSSAGGPEPLARVMQDLTSGRGVDLALELSGSVNAIANGLDLLRIGGRYVLVGSVFPSPSVAVDPERVVRRMLTIQGVHNYAPSDLAAAVAFLAEHNPHDPFEALVSRSFPLDEADAAFDFAIRSRALRVAVRP